MLKYQLVIKGLHTCLDTDKGNRNLQNSIKKLSYIVLTENKKNVVNKPCCYIVTHSKPQFSAILITFSSVNH